MQEKIIKVIQQQVFDEAYAGAKAQDFKIARYGENPNCFYRTREGLKCDVGQLIPDDRYNRAFENTSVSDDRVFKATTAYDRCMEAKLSLAGRDVVKQWLSDFQMTVHDSSRDADQHKFLMSEFARNNALTIEGAAA